MIDSELSRFLLWNYRIPFRENRHIFGWASVLTFLHRGYGRIPVIYGDGLSLTGPRPLVDHFEPLCPADRILIPAQEPLRTNIEADWETFNGELATHTARVAYFHLLPHRDIMMEPFTHGIPGWEAGLTPVLYPALSALFGLLLRLKPEAVADSHEQALRIVDAVDGRVADGRRFLWGDRLTLSDISFATALAPFLLPPGYSAPIPDLPQMPPVMQNIVISFRNRPSGELVKRIYQARAADSAGGITP
ncbi:MAG TPA: glutathione S-transferase C-terminal domain-containing protein [Bradyrhizobium sp.]